MRARRGRGCIEWRAGGWLGTQLGSTLWILLSGLALLPKFPTAGGVLITAFAASNTVGYALWANRDRRDPHFSLQLLLVVAWIAGATTLAAMHLSAVPWLGPSGLSFSEFTPWYYLCLLAYPIAMYHLFRVEMRARRLTEGPPFMGRSGLIDVDPGFSRTIQSPVTDATVTINGLGEQRMGLQPVEIFVSPPVDGVRIFQSNNGGAFFDQDSPLLAIHDASLLVLIRHDDPPSASHYQLEVGEVLQGVEFCDDGVRISVAQIDPVTRRSAREDRVLALTELSDGLGPARGGRMPSASLW